MSADENIQITVDDASVDAAIAKLENALNMQNQLVGSTSETQGQSDFASFWSNIEKQTADAKRNAADFIANEGQQISGVETSSQRIIRMIPGLREADRIHRNMQYLTAGNIVGVIGLLMVAYQIYRQIQSFMAEQQRKDAEYRSQVMQAQNFTRVVEFERWQEDERRKSEYYRIGVIP